MVIAKLVCNQANPLYLPFIYLVCSSHHILYTHTLITLAGLLQHAPAFLPFLKMFGNCCCSSSFCMSLSSLPLSWNRTAYTTPINTCIYILFPFHLCTSLADQCDLPTLSISALMYAKSSAPSSPSVLKFILSFSCLLLSPVTCAFYMPHYQLLFQSHLFVNSPECLILFHPFVRIWVFVWRAMNLSSICTSPRILLMVGSRATNLTCFLRFWHYHFAGTVPHSTYFGSPSKSKHHCTAP